MLPFKSLDAATSTGAGASHDLETVARDFTLWVTDADFSQPGTATVQLQGSPDGTIWRDLSSGGISTTQNGALGTFTTATGSSWCRFVRANVTFISGGRVVTAWIAAYVPGEEG